MRVEDLQVVVRPRPPMEAVDLGFLLLKRNASSVFVPWLLVLMPLSAALLAVFWKRPGWAILALWWLKPALDRLPLSVLAQATFGQVPGPMETLRLLARAPRIGLLASLTWRRFAPGRAMSLPVWQLEGLKGAAWRRRWSVLARRGGGSAAMLNWVCLHFDAILQIAFIGILALMVPASSDWSLLDWLFGQGGSGPGPGRLFFIAAVAGTGIIEPFYVAGGFGLYLVRRAELEGWDIELSFRALAQRMAGKGLRAAAQALVVLAFSVACLGAQEPPKQNPPTVRDWLEPTEPTPGSRPAGEPKRVITEVMQGKVFGVTKEIHVPEWFSKKPEPKTKKKNLDLAWLRWIGEALAPFLKAIFIASLFAAVAWVLWHYRESLRRIFQPDRAYVPPDLLFGLDIRPENLPDDLAAAAWKLWQAGSFREALALLYRGTLASLVHVHGLELGSGATEGDCLRAAGRVLGVPAQDYFSHLTRAWLLTAYRHAPPESGTAQRLCETWTSHFARPVPGAQS